MSNVDLGKPKMKECPECHKKVTRDRAEPHAVSHWGEKLADAAARNPDAKKRIEELTGVKY